MANKYDLNVSKEAIDDARSAFWEAQHRGEPYEAEWQGEKIMVYKGSMMERVIKEHKRNNRFAGLKKFFRRRNNQFAGL